MASKEQLRKEYVSRRDALAADVRKRASNLIRQRIFQHSAWQGAENILCYVSFRSEVDTHTLIQEGVRFKKKMHVPIYHPLDANKTPISALKRWGDLVPEGKGGLLEPRTDARELADPTKIQLVIVPGLIFDRQGGRIGFGGGYFDRVLARMPQAKRIGIAFSEQIYPTPLPSESFDIRMQAILTEKEEIIP